MANLTAPTLAHGHPWAMVGPDGPVLGKETMDINAYSEELSDGSVVWNVQFGDEEIACLSREHAEQCEADIRLAFHRATGRTNPTPSLST